jgi:O-succinylbenzoate synthase
VGFELVRIAVPLRQAWVSRAGSFSVRDTLLVRAVCRHEGTEVDGWGECTALPAPTFSSEYTTGALEVAQRFLVPALLGARTACALEVGPVLAAIKGHNMAKAAFETALLDAELRAQQVRLADHLYGQSHGLPAARPWPAPTAVTAGVAVGLTGSMGRLLDEVGSRADEGYRRVKLKVHPGWDVEPLRAVREAWPELSVFADANGAYADLGPGEAARRLAALDELDLVCLEQPLGDDDLAGHAWLAGQLKTPLCLDEALPTLASLSTALEMGACSVVNIKAGRMGGYLVAVQAHDLCAEKGAPAWCGGMVETGLGRAANLALASLPNFSLPGDLSASSRFFEADITDELPMRPDGTIEVPSGPGTGVVVDKEALARFTTWRQWWPGVGN